MTKKKEHPVQNKASIVMKEFNKGKLHSGSKSGPVVTNPKQAIAIAVGQQKSHKKK
jgi:hypothetical protein